MAIPTFNELMLPVLDVLAPAGELSSAQVREAVAVKLKLSPSDLAEALPSKVQSKFTNRVHWALFYMVRGGLVERVRRGVHKITARGREVLAKRPEMSVEYLLQFPEFAAWHTPAARPSSGALLPEEKPLVETIPPDEQLANAYVTLRRHVEDELLARIMEKSPEFFEHLVLRLLRAMGYGAEKGDAEHRGGSGDGGLDGVIWEDKLRLDAIYLQAKRYDPAGKVPAREVRDFIGALDAAHSKRGVFITTACDFAKDSLELVRHIEKRIVLINGRRLVGLMFDHDVGVREKDRFVVKEVDEDTFLDEE